MLKLKSDFEVLISSNYIKRGKSFIVIAIKPESLNRRAITLNWPL